VLGSSSVRASLSKLDSSTEKSTDCRAASTAARGAGCGLSHGVRTARGPAGSCGGGEFVAHPLSISSGQASSSLDLSDLFRVGIGGILPCDVIGLAFGVALGDGLGEQRLGGVELGLPLILKGCDVGGMGGLLGIQRIGRAPILDLPPTRENGRCGHHSAPSEHRRRDQR